MNYPDAIRAAAARLGSVYELGAKWDNLSIGGSAIDCSGFSKWVLFRAGVTLPDGSYNQIKVCLKLPASLQQKPPALALGFYSSNHGTNGEGIEQFVDHVVISMGTGVVIEARGEPYNAVIVRPVQAWLDQPGFLGFYAPPGIDLGQGGA